MQGPWSLSIGFQTNFGKKYHGYYDKHSSQSHRVVFLSLELYLQSYVQTSFSLRGSIHQFDNAVQETI